MVNWEDHKDLILELKAEGLGSGRIADHLKKMGVEINHNSERTIRKKLAKWNRSQNSFEQKLEEDNFTFPENWKYGWVKDKKVSVFIKNTEDEVSLDDLVTVIKDAVGNISPRDIKPIKKSSEKALRVVISDAHVGMDSNAEDAMFGFEYNDQIFSNHLDLVFEHVSSEIEKHGNFDLIIVDDLGDGLDGLNAETTRGGHKLQQNMTNKEAWSAYVENKLTTICQIIELNGAKRYQFRNVTNCNHSGTFGWMANMAIKMAIEQMYSNLDYIILNRPMEHFEYGNHTFILTHGKDSTMMVRNWSFTLTDKIANLIRQYIDHHEIKTKYVHLDKGDLHRCGYDREPRFDYRNYMSFAPPSPWVQANFGVSYCGFSKQIIPKWTNEIEHTDIFFELEKV